MSTTTVDVRDLIVQELKKFLANAINYCKMVTNEYPAFRQPRVFLACVYKVLEPFLEQVNTNPDLKYLLQELNIKLDDVLGVTPEEAQQVYVPTQIQAEATMLANLLRKK